MHLPQDVPLARPVGLTDVPPVRPRADEMLLQEWSRSAAWLDVGILVVATLAAEWAIGMVIGGFIGGEVLAQDPLDVDLERNLNVACIPLRAFAALATIALIVRWRGQTSRSLGVGRRGLGWNLLIGLISPAAVGCMILGLSLGLWLLWPGVMRQMTENADRLTDLLPKLHPAGFVALMVVVGIYEEVVFRGFLLPRFRRAMGSWTLAVIFSTALFTSLHAMTQTPVALIHIAILSLTFSIVTIWRRSIVPAVIGHSLYNLSVVFILYVYAGDSWT